MMEVFRLNLVCIIYNNGFILNILETNWYSVFTFSEFPFKTVTVYWEEKIIGFQFTKKSSLLTFNKIILHLSETKFHEIPKRTDFS